MSDYRIVNRARLLYRLRDEADRYREEAERLLADYGSPERVTAALIRAVVMEEAAEIVHYETKHSEPADVPDTLS